LQVEIAIYFADTHLFSQHRTIMQLPSALWCKH